MKAKDIVFEFIMARKWYYIIGIIILIITTVTASYIPTILGIVTDGIKDANMPAQEIRNYVLLIVILTVLVFVLKYFWRYFLIGNCRFVECFLRERLFKHMQSLSATFFDNHKTGDLVAYAINDIQAVRMIFGFGSIAILEGAILNGASIFFMVTTIDPVFTIIALAPSFLFVLVLFRIRLLIRERFGIVQKTFALVSEKVEENIMGIRVVKSFAQEDEEVKDFLKYSQQRVDTQMSLTKVSALLGPATQVCFGISFMIFIIYGSELVARGSISLGDYVAFNSYMMLIMGPISNIVRIIEVWQRGLASMKRLDEIFMEKSNIVEKIVDSNNESDIDIDGSIEIRNLNFKYPGSSKEVLKDINITVPRGKVLGILGQSGSGKTTLVNVILRLYPISDGKIFIDGQDINGIPLKVLRERIGCVPQEHFLFSSTIRENIGFFSDSYSDMDIEEAARLSAVYDNITAFPDGFDTIVGERGVTLSGGQKQRISIARAIVKRPSILILDDSLSAVDTTTEEEILKNMKVFLDGITGIIISHRASAIRHADIIAYMDDGRIAELGEHNELMKMRGKYFNLYKLQSEDIESR